MELPYRQIRCQLKANRNGYIRNSYVLFCYLPYRLRIHGDRTSIEKCRSLLTDRLGTFQLIANACKCMNDKIDRIQFAQVVRLDPLLFLIHSFSRN